MIRIAMLVVLLVASVVHAQPVVWLDELDLRGASQEWGTIGAKKSVDGNPLRVGERAFERGVGTHANSAIVVVLDGQAVAFDAAVGVDDEKIKNSSLVFRIVCDGKERWNSGTMRFTDSFKEVHVDLVGVQRVELLVDDAGDGIDSDHADWCDARFTLVPNAKSKPRVIEPIPSDIPQIASTKPRDEPAIRGPRVVGTTPGRPFIHLVPATGKAPLEFRATGLPEGLSIDSKTGIIAGSVRSDGESRVTITARNALGESTRTLTIVAGKDKLARTPPMGWNSWNVWGTSVDAAKVRAAADALVSSGLAAHGYSYINIDDAWEGTRDANGNIQTNDKFGDMKALADYVHSKGLKLGIYSSPGPKTCAGYEGSFQHEEQDARTWAAWGIDYLKYDWCSCTSKDHVAPYATMRNALDKVDRDIVYSFCQYGMAEVWKWGADTGANLWRTTGDITDTWSSMEKIGFSQSDLAPFAGPGRWNDPDMLVVGQVGWGPKIRPTRLKPIEQQTHITLWAMLGAPLLIGCDLTKIDDFTRDLLCNDEVLEVNQDPLGKVAKRIKQDGQVEVWTRPLFDGTIAVAVFNRGTSDAHWVLNTNDLGLTGEQPIRDLWQQTTISFDGGFSTIRAHGSILLKVGTPKE